MNHAMGISSVRPVTANREISPLDDSPILSRSSSLLSFGSFDSEPVVIESSVGRSLRQLIKPMAVFVRQHSPTTFYALSVVPASTTTGLSPSASISTYPDRLIRYTVEASLCALMGASIVSIPAVSSRLSLTRVLAFGAAWKSLQLTPNVAPASWKHYAIWAVDNLCGGAFALMGVGLFVAISPKACACSLALACLIGATAAITSRSLSHPQFLTVTRFCTDYLTYGPTDKMGLLTFTLLTGTLLQGPLHIPATLATVMTIPSFCESIAVSVMAIFKNSHPGRSHGITEYSMAQQLSLASDSAGACRNLMAAGVGANSFYEPIKTSTLNPDTYYAKAKMLE